MKISVVNWLKILCLTNFSNFFNIVNSTSAIFSNQFTFRLASCNANNNIHFITNEQCLDSYISEIARSVCIWIKEHYCPQWPSLHNGQSPLQQSFFGRQSILSLLFKPLYNGHFLLSPTWLLLFPHVVSASSMKKYPDKTTFWWAKFIQRWRPNGVHYKVTLHNE